MPKRTYATTRIARKKAVRASVRYEPQLLAHLKNPREAAAYLEAAIEEGDEAGLMVALRHVAHALGGVAVLARKSKLTREATYRMLSESGNPELRSLTAMLGAAGLRLSVKPIVKSAESRLTPHNPVSGAQLKAARKIMKRRCAVLRELA